MRRLFHIALLLCFAGSVFGNIPRNGGFRYQADGQYTAYATNTFNATGGADTVTNLFDGNGNVTRRVWINSDGQTNRTQTLTWDAFDRLINVVDRDTVGSGQNWVGIFDGLGRKVRTITTLVVSNTPITSPAEAVSTVDSWFDPLVEFQEVCVAVNGGYPSLKTYGPDANGVYGGLNGVGGLERIETYGQVTPVGIIQDYFGNVVGTITNHTVAWNPARFSSYGPVPGYQQSTLSLNTPLAQSVGWRGKHIESIGSFYWGARPYEPSSGRFLSHDPASDPGNPGGYSTCGGDLVNSFDPDARAPQLIGIAYDQSTGTISGNYMDPGYIIFPTPYRGVGFPEMPLRVQGAFMMIGGGGEMAVGIAGGTVSSPTIAGAAAGIAITAHGGLTFGAGLNQLVTGDRTRTIPAQLLDNVTGNATASDLLDAGGGIAFSIGGNAMVRTTIGGNYVFRGTSVGYEGNASTIASGLTPVTTDPSVATLFATESSRYGAGVVQIANRADLTFQQGNWFSGIERELGAVGTPAGFTSNAELTLSAGQSRSILQGMGFDMPSAIGSRAQLSDALLANPGLSLSQTSSYLGQAIPGLFDGINLGTALGAAGNAGGMILSRH